MTRIVLFGVMVTALPASVFGQAFNIDVGQPGGGPSAGYAGAGLPGVWNAIPVDHMTPYMTGPHPDRFMLVDIFGNPTGVGLHQYGGADLTSLNDPSLTGNNALLMNDVLITHSATLETCTYLNGLEDGPYEVIVYAWMPNQPGVMQRVRFDFVPETEDVGGVWPGQHLEGVTYSKYIINVTNGFMGLHVGIPPGGSTAIGAAWNGMQIRPLSMQGVPATSTWGFVVFGLMVLTVGTLLFERLGIAQGPFQLHRQMTRAVAMNVSSHAAPVGLLDWKFR